LRKGPYRFFFFAGDRTEPVHVHVAREDKTAKFCLSPVRPAYTRASHRGNWTESRASFASIRLS
jgi:hypothetical protein